jgi:V/A-type H+-transporting ATPase subunit I
MILPMKKYSMLVHHADFEQFLINLQNLGVVDVTDRGVEPDVVTQQKIDLLQQYDRTIKFLSAKINKESTTNTDLSAQEIVDKISAMQAELDDIRQKGASLEKLYRMLRPWGDFDRAMFDKLEAHGFKLRFYVAGQRKYNPEWAAQYNLEIISETDGQVYFVIVDTGQGAIEIDAEEVRAPERAASGVIAEREKHEERATEISTYFKDQARAFIPKLLNVRNELLDQINFKNVVQNSATEADDQIRIVQGWVPAQKADAVDIFLNEQSIFFLVENPVKGEKVPILLKNGKYSTLFEPIGKLYSLPKYGELDLVPFFAPFFMMFFGFCLGDAGYGLLFLIGATIAKPRVDGMMKKIVTLGQWLGGATIIFGALTGTFFGMNLIEMVDNGNLTWLAGVRTYMLDSEKMFYLALILGAIQILYGMGIKAANLSRQFGFRYAFSTLGWMLLIVGGIVLYLLRSDNNQQLIITLFYVLLGISGILILFMNNPDKNIFINFGGGLWDVYSVVTGVLGDLLSYIRLFALGVSSAILGYVFNDLATQMSGSIPVVSQIIFVLILLIGHGLNIFMASLGAFVHPLRLTFVEFYKNAGFQGGGKPYNPFMKKEEAANESLF